MQKDTFLGTWSLVSYTKSREGHPIVVHPYGENPAGFLIYTPELVSVHIMRSNRLKKDTYLEKKIESAENYGGYIGNYEIKEDTIIHYPKVSSFIDFLQVPQIRKFKFQNNLLILEYSSLEHDKKILTHLIWQRIK